MRLCGTGRKAGILKTYLAELLFALLLPIFANTFSSPRDIAFFLQCPQEVQVLAGQRRGAFWGVFAPQCKLVDWFVSLRKFTLKGTALYDVIWTHIHFVLLNIYCVSSYVGSTSLSSKSLQSSSDRSILDVVASTHPQTTNDLKPNPRRKLTKTLLISRLLPIWVASTWVGDHNFPEKPRVWNISVGLLASGYKMHRTSVVYFKNIGTW